MNRATSPTGWVRNPDGTLGWTWNPITGCLNHVNGLCKGGGFPCYAYKLANRRLKPLYLANNNIAQPPFPQGGEYGVGALQAAFCDPFYPRFWEERLDELNPCAKLKHFTIGGGSKVQPKGVFVCDMGDLFGIGIPYLWTQKVLDVCKFNQGHRFYLLTKQPQNLIKFSPFPDNAWVGVTATRNQDWERAYGYMTQTISTVRYVSFEPLLERIHNLFLRGTTKCNFDWVIIGACTGTVKEMSRLFDKYPQLTPMDNQGKWTLQPRIEWVREIVEAADKVGIPVFLKDNLKPLLENEPLDQLYWANVSDDERGHERVDDKLRQEMPKVVANCPI